MKDFLNDLRIAIRESGMTITAIAKQSGVPKGTIHYWLSKDECNPTLLLLTSVLETIGYQLTIK